MSSLDIVKKQATILKNFLKTENVNITHSSSLEAVAKMNNFKNWNTMKSNLEKNIEHSRIQDLEDQLDELRFYVDGLSQEHDELVKQVNDNQWYIDCDLKGIDPNPG